MPTKIERHPGKAKRHPGKAKSKRFPGTTNRSQRHPGKAEGLIRDPWPCHVGFTLLELVTVIAILGVLLSVALPSYRNYTLRVNRTEAVSALLELAGCQERVAAMTGRYDTTRCLPAALDHYVIRMQPNDETAALVYTAWADPEGTQEDDSCGSFGLDQTGLRQVTGEGANALACWRARGN